MEAVKIAEMISRPQVISELAKSLKDGSCEIKIEQGKIVIVRIERTVKYRN